nr:hypothetical protein [Novosphingobium sp. Gsoil 351]
MPVCWDRANHASAALLSRAASIPATNSGIIKTTAVAAVKSSGTAQCCFTRADARE